MLSKENSLKIGSRFFKEVWNAPYNMETVDDLVSLDYKLTTDGKSVEGREMFKKWILGMQAKIIDLKVIPQEMLATDEGARVITRLIVSGYNNGLFGTEPDRAPIELSLISILEIENNKITRNWAERSFFELYQRLTAPKDNNDEK